MNIQQRLSGDVLALAKRRYNNDCLAVLYVKLAEGFWRVFVFNTQSKVIVVRGTLKSTPESALISVRDSLIAAIRKMQAS